MAQRSDHARPRFLAGDPLRAVAALSVLAYHVAISVAAARGGLNGDLAFGTQANRLLFMLRIGLYVFFVLSGYLLAGPFIRALVDGRPLPDTRRYVRNRVLRIVPAFWVVAAVTLLLTGTLGAGYGQVVAIFGFAQAWHPGPLDDRIAQTWTLGVEMVFYLLLPLAAWLLARAGARRLPRAGRLAAVLALALAMAVASLALRASGFDQAGYYYEFPVMLWAFAPGVALAVAEVALAGRRLKAPAWRAVPALLLVSAAVAYWFASRRPSEALALPLLSAAFSTSLVGAALVKQWADGGAWRVLDNPVMRYLGERSYSIYLVHVGVNWIIAWHVWGSSMSAWRGLAIGVPAALACSAALAEVLHRCVERPFLRLKARGRTATAGAAAALEPVPEPAPLVLR